MSVLTAKEKRKARIITLQAIYANELKGSELNDTCDLFLKQLNLQSKKILNYGKKLGFLVISHSVEMDKLIEERSRNWDFNRIAILDKLILRMALVEMIYIESVPHKVSISESVEIAKEFSTEDSSSFINGILDSVYNEIIKKNKSE